jgi:hypothetical protein
MLARIDKSLFYYHDDRIETRGAFDKPSDDSPGEWGHQHWSDTESLNATAYYYEDGLYGKLKSLKNNNSPLTNPPFSRGGEFTESFADKFLSVKRPTYGTIIFNDRLSWWTGKGQTKELNGFGGGNLSAFWTPETGSVLLGGSRGTRHTGHDLDEWREWPVHALSGETDDGRAFSSGLQRYPEATYELDRNPGRVTIMGDLTNSYPDPRDGLGGQADYKRVFRIKENGVEVTTSVQADGSNRVKELYEVLPVYKRNAYRQSSATPTSIEFKVNGSWQQAGTNFQEVSSIRLSRFNGQVYIDFERPARVKLSPEDFYKVPDKKSGMQARNIMIDLLGTDGQATELTDRSVSYFMRSSKAEPNQDWGQDGEEEDPPSDTSPPSIDISHSPDSPDNSQEINITADATDDTGIDQVDIFLKDKKVKTCEGKQTCTVAAGPYDDGTYIYYATATDTNGNKAKSLEEEIIVATKDTTPPEVEVTHSPSNPSDSQEITLEATASDESGISQIALFVEDEKVKTCEGKETCTVKLSARSEGTYSYYATATDKDGNEQTTSKEQLVVEDKTAPEVSISHSPSDPYKDEIVIFTAGAEDENGIQLIEIYVDAKLEKTCSNVSQCVFKNNSFSLGEHKYYVKAIDKSSNENSGTSKTKTLEVRENPSSNNPPEEVHVVLEQKKSFLESEVANVSDPDGDKVRLNYDWRLDGESIAVVNYPFDLQTQAQPKAKITDYSSNENFGLTGKRNASPKWISNGKKGGAMEFDGSNDFLHVPSDKTLENISQFTVETWIKHEQWGDDWASIISKPISADAWQKPWAVFKLSRNSNKDNLNFQITVGDNEPVSLQSEEDIPNNKWTHVAGTYDGENLKLFINGTLDKKLHVGKALLKQTNTDVFIAKNSNAVDSGEYYKGALDELKIFNKPLSAAQVQNHYAGNYKQLSLEQTNAGERWEVAVTANDTKSRAKTVTSNSIITEKEEREKDADITISQNYPNPFSSSTTIDMELQETEIMTVKVYDTIGRHVRTVFDGNMESGSQTMEIDGSNLSSGIYFCRFVMEDEVITQKMTFIK